MDNNRPLQIAIDGPVGSGKGTLAVALAKELNATHIYTGGMWRALALACLRVHVDMDNEEQVLDVLRKSNIDLRIDSDTPLTKVFLDGEDVTNEIFFPEVSNATPTVAAHKQVRIVMAELQKKIAYGKKGVIEGRDVATHIIPNADLKIYLTASVDERANRRYKQLREKHVEISYNEVRDDVVERDRADSQREHAPLVISPDSVVIDTSNDTIEDTVNKVKKELRNRNLI
ncbi:MAG: (d)CMP kinase [Candidatus Levybacteria bacterium]|nr:(d)CMP kinase [Candidatus Levybacteria bacterium]